MDGVMRAIVCVALCVLGNGAHGGEEPTGGLEPVGVEVSQALLEMCGEVVGFARAQEASVRAVSQAHPGFAEELIAGQLAFEDAFGGGIVNAEALLREHVEDAEVVLAKIDAAVSEKLKGETIEVSHGAAYVAQVRGRAGGEMPPGLLRGVLALTPAYIEDPEKELEDAWGRLVRTLGTPAYPVPTVSVEVPMSWSTDSRLRGGGVLSISRAGAGLSGVTMTLEIRVFSREGAASGLGMERVVEVLGERGRVESEGLVLGEVEEVLLDRERARMVSLHIEGDGEGAGPEVARVVVLSVANHDVFLVLDGGGDCGAFSRYGALFDRIVETASVNPTGHTINGGENPFTP